MEVRHCKRSIPLGSIRINGCLKSARVQTKWLNLTERKYDHRAHMNFKSTMYGDKHLHRERIDPEG
jgi:hypothetical protein